MPQRRHTSRRDNPDGYPPPLPNEAEVRLIEACGLRRAELLNLRVRDIRQSPDGFLYVLTDEKDGSVLRIEPAP